MTYMSEYEITQGRIFLSRAETDLTPKAKRTRAALVSAARTLIGEKGATSLTVMEVCDVAGVGRTSFYNYFNDADALIEAVAVFAAEAVKDEFNALHEDVPRGLERLQQCLTMVLNIAADDPETALLITALAQSTSAIPYLLRYEITQELKGAVNAGSISWSAPKSDALAQFLTLSTLAICREIALGKLPKDQIAAHVGIMIGACKAHENDAQ